jgi:membrane protease YdiL (CAAX protease family)
MTTALVVVGAAAQAGAWWFVVARGADVWRTTVPVLAAVGLAAMLAGPPPLSPDVRPALSAAAGVGAGAALYAATRGFVLLTRSWRTFHRHSLAMYVRRGRLPLGWVLVLAVAVGAPGEELFWRGLVQQDVAAGVGGPALAMMLAWLGYVAVNLPSRNLAVVAGATVGGAVWGSLGWWTGGALAPLLSHAVWTAMMITFPVVREDPSR